MVCRLEREEVFDKVSNVHEYVPYNTLPETDRTYEQQNVGCNLIVLESSYFSSNNRLNRRNQVFPVFAVASREIQVTLNKF